VKTNKYCISKIKLAATDVEACVHEAKSDSRCTGNEISLIRGTCWCCLATSSCPLDSSDYAGTGNSSVIRYADCPSLQPSSKPSLQPFSKPSYEPSSKPSLQPSSIPSSSPSLKPSSKPSLQPSYKPSLQPSYRTSLQHSSQPSQFPSIFDPFNSFVFGVCVNSADESTEDANNRHTLLPYDNADPTEEEEGCHHACNNFYFNQAEQQQQEISGCQVDSSGCYIYHTTNFVVQNFLPIANALCAVAESN